MGLRQAYKMLMREISEHPTKYCLHHVSLEGQNVNSTLQKSGCEVEVRSMKEHIDSVKENRYPQMAPVFKRYPKAHAQSKKICKPKLPKMLSYAIAIRFSPAI